MTQLASEILIELAPFALLLLIVSVIYGVLGVRSMLGNARLSSSDYIVFEAEPGNMGYIEADLADSGWRLVDTRATETKAIQCRFEKSGAGSRCLSEIFDFDRFMPRTQRSAFGSVIKVKEHGARSNPAAAFRP